MNDIAVSKQLLTLLEEVKVGDMIGIKLKTSPEINNEYVAQIIKNPMWFSDEIFWYGNSKVWFRDNQYKGEGKYHDLIRHGIEITAIFKREPNGNFKRIGISHET